MATAEQYAAARNLLLESTLVPFKLGDLLEAIEAYIDSVDLLRVVQAFEYNLAEAVSVAALPFTFGSEIANRELFQRLHIAARIRSQLLPNGGREVALENARAAFQEAVSEHQRPESENEYDYLFEVISATNELLSSEGFRDRSQSLLRQSTVLTWNALEVFARDLLEVVMNENRDSALTFIKDQDASTRFELKKISLISLESYKFDLSNRLGTFILEGRDLSDISSLRIALFALFSSCGDLQTILKSRELFALCKKRHLFVHRRGIVDNKFHVETGCSEKIGEQFIVLPRDLERDINLVWETSKKILMSALVTSTP